MKTINSYLSPEQFADLEGMSDHEKLALVLSHIQSMDPKATFRCRDLAEFLGKDPRHPRGMFPMVEAIKRKDPSFPIEMIVTGSGKKSYDSKKVDEQKARWAATFSQVGKD